MSLIYCVFGTLMKFHRFIHVLKLLNIFLYYSSQTCVRFNLESLVFNKTEFVPIYPQVKEDYPHLVGPNTCVSRKLGFPDVIMPGQKSIRHSFCSLSFIRISKFLSMYHYYQSFIQSVLCHWL